MSTKKKARTRYMLLIGVMALLPVLVFAVFHSLYDEYCGTLPDQKLKHLLLISRANASILQTQYENLTDDCRVWIEDRDIAAQIRQHQDPFKPEASLDRFLARNTDSHYLYAALLITLLTLLFFMFRESTLMRAEQRHLSEMNSMLLDIQTRQTQLHQKENLQALGLFTSNSTARSTWSMNCRKRRCIS